MKIACSYTKLVAIDEIRPHPSNRNTHPDKQIKALAKIIAKVGMRSPLVVSNLSGYLVKGHGRLAALQLLGVKEVPVDFQDYENELEELNDRIADNEIARYAEFDQSGFLEDLKAFELTDIDFEEFGLIDFELPKVEVIPQCDEDDVPEPPKEPKTVKGDLYEFGEHRLLCGDSTMIDDVEKLMNGQKADMVFTDPPYNVASESSNMASDVSKSMNNLKNADWDKNFKIETPLINAINSSKDSATYYIFTSHWLFQNIMDVLKEYCDFNNYLVWSKPNPMPSLMKRHPTWNTELCCYGTRGTERIVNFPKEGHFLSCRDVVKKTDGSHPTQKPQELIIPLIEFSSGKNQLILDLFLGSGSTLIACEKTNRKCYGMEIDEHYCDVIVSRWCKYTGQNKIKLNGQEIIWEVDNGTSN